MSGILAWIAAMLNVAADAVGRRAFAFIGLLPGWLSSTLIAAITGVLLLSIFKYTSNQGAIHRTRNRIDANLLALKLFKDSARVALASQGRILTGAGRLFVLALVPMLVMAVPVTLLLGQLGLWYEARPLPIGEMSVITLSLGGDANDPWPPVSLEPTAAVEIDTGPVRVRSRREICWSVRAVEPGLHHLTFHVGDRTVDKDVAIGDGFMRVSAERPGWDAAAILLNPAETPFRRDAPVRSIAIAYPGRSSWTSGTGSWIVYWFIVSMVAALCFRRALNVKV